MKTVPFRIIAGLFFILTGCATTPEAGPGRAAGVNGEPLQVQGPNTLTTAGGMTFEVPVGFTASAKGEVVTLHSDEFDLWFSHLLMGRAYFEAGHYAEAFDELDVEKALSEAIAKKAAQAGISPEGSEG